MGDPDQGGAERAEGFLPLCNGQIDQVDIDGKAREVPDKEVDGRPALQGKDDLPIDQGQSPQKQLRLAEINIVHHWDTSLRSTGTVI